MDNALSFNLQCPIPIRDYPIVTLAHGGGGSLMGGLIEKMILPAFQNPLLAERHDGAVFDSHGRKMAFTTDSYVVRPLVFPGGDIGTMAINGTVNDLAMCGAKPLYLSVGFILEEGLSMETLWKIICSMSIAAGKAGVQIVTGDTKVVDKGKGDGLYINTAGVGALATERTISPAAVCPGDVILLSGDVGRHGVAIMAVREGLTFETTIQSDCAPLHETVLELLQAGIEVHCLRDLTRGGLASALVEIANTSRKEIRIDEKSVAVEDQVQGACELLGLDPLYVANEGRFAAFVAPQDADRALNILRKAPGGEKAARIGHVSEIPQPHVLMTSCIGALRVIDLLSGEQLPRIC
ncbi:MAG TPA: hydrogenase expression/formation protein HypE [Verrucomicrobia bacterium]|nr:MAG: hydrogenase expression/formation protein HypE [Lentisphaerae bacterium GWF2_57_35]HBA83586.1 hydrogenase expression/formation protein HypE [Verrucomicrobiota bacterium]